MKLSHSSPKSTAELPPPMISTRLSLSMGDERADAGRDGQTCLARRNSMAQTGTGKCSFSHHKQDWQPYPVDPYSAMI